MAELAHFKNFAKLKDTSVEFNDITVLAGKPGTGKSYVMKFMYSYDEASVSILNTLDIESATKIQEILKPLLNSNNEILEQILNNSFETGMFEILSSGFEKKIQEKIKNILNSTFTDINQISGSFSVDFKNKRVDFRDNILNIELMEDAEKSIKKSLENPIDIDKINKNIIFVETPLILEFKKFMDRREGKTPYHIESLLNILDTDYSFTDEEQDRFITKFREKSQKIIEGDIESSGDSFIFNRKDDKNYDILNASSGIKSIGLLQYLVTNKALKKGSVLFWEEPEVHLHPSWQLKMVDLFVELMNAGIKIVFSTHSPYMADYLNAISKRNNYRDRISFNVLDEKDGVVTNHILDDDNWDILQKELMDTFEDILWQYL